VIRYLLYEEMGQIRYQSLPVYMWLTSLCSQCVDMLV
jgi:hypothetical protein